MRHFLQRHLLLLAAVLTLVGVSWGIAQNLEDSRFPSKEYLKVITEAPQQPVEIGLVPWGRDLEAAQKESADSGKPILLLFQEVPG